MRSSNSLLQSFSEKDFAAIRADLQPVEMPRHLDIEVPDEPIEYVYFPEAGIISVVATETDGQVIEVALLGCEGMSGLAILNGTDRTPLHSYVQMRGHGQRIRADLFRKALLDSRSLEASCRLFAETSVIQIAHTALSNGRRSIDERLARWILMCTDRGDGVEIELTHEFMSVMLGVRRAGVTTALHMLEGEHMIRSTRGLITVLDKAKLHQKTNGSYGIPEKEYRRLMKRDFGYVASGVVPMLVAV